MDTKLLNEKYVANTYARQDILFVSGKDSTLVDDMGREYIDFGGGIAVNGMGIANDTWLKAVIKQAKKLPHTSNLYYSEPQAKLAQLLCKKTKMKKVFFSNSGAEANECAIKCARKYSFDKYGEGRYEIVTLQNSFHGRTMATLSATGQDSFHRYFMPFLDGFKYAQANNIQSVRAAIGGNTAAVMIELVQGEGGVVALEPAFVAEVAALCKQKDLILIVDEVQTGNGRTGTLYAFMQYGIMPDIITTAKGLGNGLPIGATLFGKKTENVLGAGDHGSTFGANPICAAGALAVLKSINEDVLQGVKAKNDRIISALNKCSKVKSVSGLGLMLGIECDDAKGLMKSCREKGLIVITAKDKLRLLPAINISEAELTRGIEIICEVLK